MGTTIKFLWNSGAAIFWGVLILGAPFWILLSLIASSRCELTKYESFISPDKQKEAVVYIRNCGALSYWETQIIIREINDIENKNTLIYLDGHPRNIEYKVSWTPDSTIEITEFKFEDLLNFHSRNTTGDVAKSVIRPKGTF